MTAITHRQLEAARQNLRRMDPATDWNRITGPVDDLRIPACPLPDFGALWLPGGQRVAFVEGGV